MKRILSFAIFAGLFLVLGVLAFMARPNGDVVETENQEVVAGAPVQQEATAPEAPTAAENYNPIAFPLDASGVITPFTAAGLLTHVGSSATEVARVNEVRQDLDTWSVFGFGTVNGTFTTDPNDFPLEVGGAYWLKVNNTADNTFTLVGDVPAQGSIQHTLFADATGGCNYNQVMLPLDQTGVYANANDIITDIGSSNVSEIARLNPTRQDLDTWSSFGFGTVNGLFTTDPNDFTVTPGHSYLLCTEQAGNGTQWPTP